MRYWSTLSTRDMLRQNRSVCWWGAVREKRGKKTHHCEEVPSLEEAGQVLVYSLLSHWRWLLVLLTAFWWCHSLVLMLGGLEPDQSDPQHCWNPEFQICNFCCAAPNVQDAFFDCKGAPFRLCQHGRGYIWNAPFSMYYVFKSRVAMLQ